MREVSFPGFGLSFAWDRVAFTVFGHPIYWYGIIIAFGFLLAVLFCSRQAGKFGLKSDDLLDMLLFAVPLCIVGGRAYYVIFYLDLYRRADGSLDVAEMFRIWDGGLAIYGAIIMAAIVLMVFCKVRKMSFLSFADLGVFGLFIGQIVGRWGNFVNVEAFGAVTDLPWRMSGRHIANELWAQGALESNLAYQSIVDGVLGVHPTFLYESLWNLVGLILLLVILKKGRKFDGQTFLTYVFWYGLGRGFIEGLRTDSLYFFGTGLRVSQVLAFASCLAAAAAYAYLRKTRVGKPLYVDKVSAGKNQPAPEEEADHGDET